MLLVLFDAILQHRPQQPPRGGFARLLGRFRSFESEGELAAKGSHFSILIDDLLRGDDNFSERSLLAMLLNLLLQRRFDPLLISHVGAQSIPLLLHIDPL